MISSVATIGQTNVNMLNGDASPDNSVDLLDLNSVLVHFGESGGPADIDFSGTVDLLDLNTVLINFGQVGDTLPAAGSPSQGSLISQTIRVALSALAGIPTGKILRISLYSGGINLYEQTVNLTTSTTPIDVDVKVDLGGTYAVYFSFYAANHTTKSGPWLTKKMPGEVFGSVISFPTPVAPWFIKSVYGFNF